MNPYPMRMASWQDYDIQVLRDDNDEQNDTNFFRVSKRRSSGTTMYSNINIECLETGVTYKASAKIRIHSIYEEEYYFYFRYQTPDGHWHSQTYLDCPEQKFDDGWVVCEGEFTVGEHLGSAVDVSWRFHFHNERDITVTVDFDDVSIAYHEGIVDQLVVPKDDALCWAPGSEINVGSSMHYNWHWLLANSFTTAISDVTDNGDETLSLTLVDAPFIPILSLEDDEDFATDVSLLSRNIKITNSDDEVEKGAYLQVLKTPNVTQKVIGVEFINMGRRKEDDRHPFQISYSESIEGTLISGNSIRGSYNRCIVIDGTSNITISENVGYFNKGHCVYIGFESMDNLIEGNLVSDNQDAHWNDQISHENVSPSFLCLT